MLAGAPLASGSGASRKEAEQEAARAALASHEATRRASPDETEP